MSDEPFTSKERLTYAAIGAAVIIAFSWLYFAPNSIDLPGIASLLAAFGFGVALPSPVAK